MKTYVFNIEQIISIEANSLEEAEDLLPIYSTGFNGDNKKWYVEEETVELLKEVSNV
jgi:hypothetical protein